MRTNKLHNVAEYATITHNPNMFVQQQIIKNNIKKFTILSKDKTARNNSNENEPLQ